ncbi:MAG: hypothetical protein WCV82_04070 [Candidatus Paceibacterota bacterium]|jgi:hypothetical protein
MFKEKLKKIPFAIKFGVIFFVLFTLLFIVGALIESRYFPSHGDMGTLMAWVFIITTLPILLLSDVLHFPGWLYLSFSVVYLTLVGTLLGFIFQLIGRWLRHFSIRKSSFVVWIFIAIFALFALRILWNLLTHL